MDWRQELAKLFPGSPCAVQVHGAAFEAMMGAEWAATHPDVLLFLTAEDAKGLAEGKSLAAESVREAVRRFLFEPGSLFLPAPEVEALRGACRDLFLRGEPDFWELLEDRLQKSSDAVEFSGWCVLALNLWPKDPRRDADSWKMWTMAGHALKDLGDLEAAAKVFEKASELDPESVAPLHGLASVRLKQGRNDDGEALLKKVLERDPKNVMALCDLAGLRLIQRRFDELDALYKKARAIDPDDPRVRELQIILKDPGSAPSVN